MNSILQMGKGDIKETCKEQAKIVAYNIDFLFFKSFEVEMYYP